MVLQKYEVKAIRDAIKTIDSISNSNLKYEWGDARNKLWEVLDKHGWNFNPDYKLYRKKEINE